MTHKEFLPSVYTKPVTDGKVTYKAPSNIALVKYWGKKSNQIPANPSISFTLDACATTTTISYSRVEEKGNDFSFELLFEGKPKPDFRPKIEAFFNRVEDYLPFLKEYHLKIETSNSFPHSSGIASSASGMSALALGLMHIEKQLDPDIKADFFIQKASFLARLGSGSACRSIEGDLVQWGSHKGIPGSSDLYAIKYPFEVHGVFHEYQDTILLVDKGQKQVSSTVGHNLMHGHPYAEQRFDQAHENIEKLNEIFKEGNLNAFIHIVESEALTLHAMMMTSMPYFILMKPNTLKIIKKIWSFRASSNTHLCFTLDAGANVHVLYPKGEKEKVQQFIKDELVAYCENGQYICDKLGFGAKRLLP
ncbi:diphosphomevalonate/mevalonate 3,5-bisphosphate decarboxylase family protein [Maribacter polysaccharolyticus]|uniref:diphosphomevalonate/mevalonate 3,5-bisphosphate decarboxylase family protein n=1 Tax=Maribacter polysaccharolyticus TaxID=3020831 RepID=UPI00237FA175|nr:diphosphomevalonate decarboxylase [Maribacter polysaccharolyticus]MDE3742926.1 diphosphomevalonate decarboxylase [Maribacter polysaccharolyticus]